MKNSDKLKQPIEDTRYNKIENAIWLIGQGMKGKFKANRNEKISFNTIAKFYEKNKKGNLQNNELFIKMFIFTYSKFLNHFNTTIYDDVPLKELLRLLDKPISYFIDRLTNELNEREINNNLNKYKAFQYDLQTYRADKKAKIKKLEDEIKEIETLLKEEKPEGTKEDIIKALEKPFDSETIGDQLNTIINKYINII